MEFENYDIIQLHHLLDKYVYSQVNYENELNRKTIKTNISWKEILPFLHCPSLIEAKTNERGFLLLCADLCYYLYRK